MTPCKMALCSAISSPFLAPFGFEMICQPLILACATLTVVLIGLAVVFFVMFLPWIALSNVLPPMTLVALQFLHLYLLWTSTIYLSIFRRIAFPIRKPIMFLVFQIAMIEAIREETPTLYLDLSTVKRSDEGKNAEHEVMQSFRSSVRRRYKEMEGMYRQHNIWCESIRSEDALNLSHVVPIMIEHERRCCQADGKNLVEEFIKRFLVVTLFTDAVLDLYYDERNALCCVQLSVVQGRTIHWFMYFCRTSTSRCGMWYHGILNAMRRGLEIPSVQYVNAQVHQSDSKQRAGLAACEHTNDKVMRNLYPLGLTTEMPSFVLQTEVWSSVQETVSKLKAKQC